MQRVELRLADDLVVGVEAQVGEDRVQRAERHHGAVAPVREVAELPPPERLGPAPLGVVLEPVAQRDGDVDEVVGDRAVGALRRRDRVDDVDVVVDAGEDVREPGAQRVGVVVGGVGLEPLLRHDVLDRTEPRARDEHLRERERQDRQGRLGRAARGDLGHGGEERARLRRREVGEARQVVDPARGALGQRLLSHGSQHAVCRAAGSRAGRAVGRGVDRAVGCGRP